MALHIHERLSAKAILRTAARQDVQRELFADPQQEYHEAVQFYMRDVDWSNRLILGDSLTVMSSLVHREDLAGKVQMIYIDPPYGVNFRSNFQPTVFHRDVKDKASDLTREREQIKAYRDTWTLGVHSYLAYLRDRLIVARELLTDSGSVFVQIGDENLHRVRCLMDEVFGNQNYVSTINFRKTVAQTTRLLSTNNDHLLWYSKERELVKFRRIMLQRNLADSVNAKFQWLEKNTGEEIRLSTATDEELREGRIFAKDGLDSQTGSNTSRFAIVHQDLRQIPNGNRGWRTSKKGIANLARAHRLTVSGQRILYKRYFDCFPFMDFTNNWHDTMNSFEEKSYVVQTNLIVLQRCMLLTTDPGDLILDPTCGSGTTAYVAEQWGRRWITIDTSRVAVALARQRLLTGSFDYYELQDESKGVAGGFINETVPHIQLKDIAQNIALDPIFAKYEPILEEKLEALNCALEAVTSEIRTALGAKLAEKRRREGPKAVTDADRRRWELPTSDWKEWEVPFDTDPDWPSELQGALTGYRAAWREKMDEVNECIAAASDSEELVDQPKVDRKTLRVSGPFSVEAVQPAEESLYDESPIGGEPDEELDAFESDGNGKDASNAGAYLDAMIRLLRNDGVRFTENRIMKFARLDSIEGGVIHAEGAWEDDSENRLIAVAFGPQHGPVTAMQVEQCLRTASRREWDELVFAGFSFDGAAQAAIHDNPNPNVRTHMAYINPDVAMGGLLRNTPTSQLFTVFGKPRTKIDTTEEGEYFVVMEGVDVYNPVDNMVTSEVGDRVAAWFIDSDYDDRTFCIT